MSKSLTSLISDIQAALIDDGTRFNTATCTAAVREALKIFNLYAPVFAGDLMAVVAEQREYEVTDIDSRALSITGVWLYDNTNREHHIPLIFDQYSEDERLFFRLLAPQSASEQLLIRYTIPQTVSELDSHTESTLSPIYDQILIGGAKAEAMQIRADSRLETINLQQSVSDNYREQITAIRARFYAELIQVASNRYPAIGTPAEAAWNDEYHGWDR
jgi:hypothetical protein